MTDTRDSFEKVIEVLTNYNKWRRGEDESITQPAPKDIGEAIEAAIAHLSTTEARDGVNARRYLWLRKNCSDGYFRSSQTNFTLNCDEPENEWDAAIDRELAQATEWK